MLQFKINGIVIFAIAVWWLCIIQVSSEVAGLSCASCGDECAEACGTRHFRTCCFNYLRKRSGGGGDGGSGGSSSSSISSRAIIGNSGLTGSHGTQQQQYMSDTVGGSSSGIIQSSFIPQSLQFLQNDNYSNQIDAQLRQLNSIELEKLWILMDSVARRGQRQFLQPQIQSKIFEEFLRQQ